MNFPVAPASGSFHSGAPEMETLLRGVFDKERYEKEKAILKAYLQQQAKPHWREFLASWNDS